MLPCTSSAGTGSLLSLVSTRAGENQQKFNGFLLNYFDNKAQDVHVKAKGNLCANKIVAKKKKLKLISLLLKSSTDLINKNLTVINVSL